MLRFMRKQASSWMIKVLLGIIVLVFVFWGMGSMTGKNVMHVAMVNGESISIDVYRQAYGNLMENMRRRYGDRLNDDLLKTMNPGRMALDELINESLMHQEAERLGLRVSEKELVDSIQKTEYFQQNGVFNYDRYRQVLNSIRMNQQSYEARHRRELMIGKLTDLVVGQVRVSEADAREWFNWDSGEIRIDYVAFDPDAYSDILAGDEEINAFFAANPERYMTEPSVRARYLKFTPDQFMDPAPVAVEDIQSYYEEHQKEYTKEKTVEARHILLTVANDADADTVEKKRLDALKIMEAAKAGTDFAELARTHSDCPSKKNGGSLGAFTRDAMVEPFAEKAFSMKPGEISEPVRTRFGWHIIKVDLVHEERISSLEEVSADIEKKLKTEKALRLAWDKAEAIYDSSFDGDDLVKAAGEHGLDIHTTGLFTRTEMPEGISDPSVFVSTAFKLDPMEISDILELKDGFYMLQVIERIEARVPPLADIRERVISDIVQERRENKAAAEAESFLKSAAGGNLATLAAERNLTVTTTPFFGRTGTAPHIPPSQELQQVFLTLSATHPMPEKPVKAGKLYYVIQFKESRPPDKAMFDNEKKTVMEKLREQKQMQIFDAWKAQLRDAADIQIEEGILE